MRILRRISKTKDIPLEQYGYYEIEFDSREEYDKEYKKTLQSIVDKEKKDAEKELESEFRQEGNFTLTNKKK